jgi:hypothetical protein
MVCFLRVAAGFATMGSDRFEYHTSLIAPSWVRFLPGGQQQTPLCRYSFHGHAKAFDSRAFTLWRQLIALCDTVHELGKRPLPSIRPFGLTSFMNEVGALVRRLTVVSSGQAGEERRALAAGSDHPRTETYPSAQAPIDLAARAVVAFGRGEAAS